ncbi:hypothetical protein T484DRAFT_1973652 [Baffinella frigidus]|nr:hypothetical protein T484DRAFT_1973652 [Cryptophyta sp. CCMP2293]|mmetsp:Transcript_37425/g.87765  ORF Transcript_37425/g.87765 Transcript_37425/m.87765 type:complete len:251 (-) Transcript_37425:59-811(-)
MADRRERPVQWRWSDSSSGAEKRGPTQTQSSAEPQRVQRPRILHRQSRAFRGGAPSCLAWSAIALSVLVLAGVLGRVESVKCYVGTVTNTRVANDLLNLLPQQLCNSTETIIYDGCYSVCQEMIFQNSSDGVVTPIGVCKFGCSTGLACNEFKSKKAGPFDSSLVCDECTWEQTSVYWTKALYEKMDFCCPTCWMGSVRSAMKCPSSFTLEASCCGGDGCNFARAARLPAALERAAAVALFALLTLLVGR